ncbi:hypothetical protein BC832DRAFT_550323 [Gaertneriomyces semiglobifer]|nr:hypothetical protein BC832DRAFT_550323 [Gaertneriomyces semiglobifer]
MRAYFLLVAALCSVVNIANLSWGRSVSKFELNVGLHFHLAVIFGVAQMGSTLAAAAWRFGPVYMSQRARRAVTLGTACYAMGWTITLLIYGNVLVARSGRVGGVFWGLCATIPFAYCVFGLLTFARAVSAPGILDVAFCGIEHPCCRFVNFTGSSRPSDPRMDRTKRRLTC